MSNASTICISGGTGFVGIGVVSLFLERGYQIRCLVRNERSAQKLTALKEKFPNQLECIIGDVLEPNDIIRALEGCSALVHLVGIRRKEAKASGLTYDDIDVGSAIASAVAMQRSGLKRILLLSAGAIGNSYYVQCKAKAEQVIMSTNLDWTIFRLAFIIGPGQEWPVLIAPFLWMFGLLPGNFGAIARKSGNISRSELAEAFLLSLEDDSSIGKILEVPEIRRITRRNRQNN